jgi:hypothetical protein
LDERVAGVNPKKGENSANFPAFGYGNSAETLFATLRPSEAFSKRGTPESVWNRRTLLPRCRA